MTEPRPRRRKCRRPRFQTERGALWFALKVLGERDRTAYLCSGHDQPVFHLRPRLAEKVLDTPNADGA